MFACFGEAPLPEMDISQEYREMAKNGGTDDRHAMSLAGAPR
jgi:hypothetical protein